MLARIALFPWLILGVFAAPALAQKRVALVIGNSAYQHAPALANPKNDATDMAAALKQHGFRVIDGFDLDKVALERTVREFSSALRDAEVGLFYYAGHGLQVGGQNYLVPVDARAETADAVDWEMVRLDLVQRTMERATATNIIFLDACRNNPLTRNLARAMGTRSAEIGRGLAPVESGVGTLISFSTQPGNVALDGVGQRNSPFAGSLVKHVSGSSDDLSAVLIAVRNDVMKQTQRKQVPWEHSALTGRFHFRPPTSAPALPPQSSDAERAWDRTKDTTSVAALEAFIRRFGDTYYGDLAKVRLAELKGSERERLALLKADEKGKQPRATDPALSVEPGSGESFRDCPDCPEMVVVPAGSFMMGSSPSEIAALKKELPSAADFFDSEGPQRKVLIARPFAVGKFAVTFKEWDACVADGGCKHRPVDNGWGRGRQPVINISWEDAKVYTAWLSRKTSKNYGLLSEAEWEYVARAGTTSAFWWGSSISMQRANYNGYYTYGGGRASQHRQQTVPVDNFSPNPWGLYQVHGNVWEWVEDGWHPNYQGAPADGSVWSGGDASFRVLRGGSWDYLANYLRSAFRYRLPLADRYNYVGFRVVQRL